jgi:cytochrome c5
MPERIAPSKEIAVKIKYAAVTLFAAVLFSTSLALAVAMESGADLVKKKCAMCHDVSRICRSVGKRDAAEWQMTSERMARNGAKLAEGEAAKVAAFLASPQAADGLGCSK